MVVLRYEQVTKDLFLIRKLREDILYFLKAGPFKTDDFFYCHHERSFQAEDLKIKLKSLKIYLGAVYSLIQQDCVNPKFVDEVLFICECIILGVVHLGRELENELPAVLKSSWTYILCWLAKDIVIN